MDIKSQGLSTKEAEHRLQQYGPNIVAVQKGLPIPLQILLSQFKNWLVAVLIAAATISFFLGENLDGLIIISLVILSIFFGFFQEYKAEKALEKLKKYVSNKVKVKRDGVWVETDSKNIVVGDVIKLQIGDLVPADIHLLSLDDLSANESVLTGESLPVSKQIKENINSMEPQQLTNMVFMETTIAGGYGEGIITAIGSDTFFGKTAKYLGAPAPETDFQKETKKFSTFLFQIILLMTTFVFLANSWSGKGWFDSFLFAIALAVGITPELLPAIMTVTLSQGALKMAKQKVVVKRLMSVEDLGNIDTLCTDKTGTLTEGIFTLSNYVNAKGVTDDEILIKSLVCTNDFVSHKGFSTTNSIDKALWESESAKKFTSQLKEYALLDENEFDFERRRMSVLVKTKSSRLLLTKGSPESILEVCKLTPANKSSLKKKIQAFEEDGYHVIALAQRKLLKNTSAAKDENQLTFLGFLLFNDPVKPNVKESFNLFQKLGVAIKVLSGDSVTITRSVARQIGLNLKQEDIITGEQLDKLNPQELDDYARKYNFFARISPEQKYKIVATLNKDGHIVGFLGDGINDAPAIKAADVGIAVDTGAPVAKEAADIILLQKDLSVLAQGIEEGRKTFGNILKYILNTVSANYGNMFTVAISSLFLPFIPLLPTQILLTNFISDIPLFAIATDNVDKDFTKKPKRWNIKLIGRFMLYFGLISSLFDLALILPIFFFWKLPPSVFRTAWFIESSLSEIIVTFSIRTKLAFYQNTPSKFLLISSILSGVVIVVIPLLVFGQKLFSFSELPPYLWAWIGVVLAGYFSVTEIVKRFFFQKYEI